jgi:competence protein ComEA
MKGFKKINIFCTVIAILMIFASATWAVETGKININTATVQELVKLKRVGRKYAQKIVEYREAHGAFQQAEDIMKVPGIGKKTYELNKELIAVD